MPQFTWTSRDTYDVVRSGIITAPTAHRAAAELAQRAIKAQAVLPLPDSTVAAGTAGSGEGSGLELASIRTADLLTSLREMVGLLRHGVSRQRVFTALGAASHHPVLAEVLQNMGQRTQAGSPLYRAMAAWPQLFDSVVQHLVRHGEGENCLPECIKAAHAHLEFSHAMAVLEGRLGAMPPALTQAARQHIGKARALACLAAGQQAGLPLHANMELAAQTCADAGLAQRLRAAWTGVTADGARHDPAQMLERALLAADIVQPADWKRATSQAPDADIARTLQVLAQARSAQSAEATERFELRLQWGLKTALRMGAVALFMAVWLFLSA